MAAPVPREASTLSTEASHYGGESSGRAQVTFEGSDPQQGGSGTMPRSPRGRRDPFRLPPLPTELAHLKAQPVSAASSAKPSHIEPVLEKPASLTRQPSRAASDRSLGVKGPKLPFEASPLPGPGPSRFSFEGPARRRPPLSKAASLTRLPSEAASLLASSPPESSADSRCDSQDDSVSMWRHKGRQKTSVLNMSHRLIQASVAKIFTPFRIHTGRSSPFLMTDDAECGIRDLKFTAVAGRQHMDPCDALTALAEGSMQCAVTGDAFEQLLQMRDISLLETVMRSAVVFSRMQPHQKGQVMDLLGRRGIHQPYEGIPRHIPVSV